MITISSLPQKEVFPGFKARFIHTSTMTIGYWDVASGSILPLHKHVHEQVSQIEEGELELTIDGETRIYTKGMVAVIASNVEHSGRALTDCKLLDIFNPVREDYKAL